MYDINIYIYIYIHKFVRRNRILYKEFIGELKSMAIKNEFLIKVTKIGLTLIFINLQAKWITIINDSAVSSLLSLNKTM